MFICCFIVHKIAPNETNMIMNLTSNNNQDQNWVEINILFKEICHNKFCNDKMACCAKFFAIRQVTCWFWKIF